MSNAELQAFEPTEAPAPPEPGMRFPLRSMLLLTTGLALLAATIGPFYRGAHPEARSSVLVFWVGILTALALFGLFEWHKSIRRKTLVGRRRFQLRRVNRPSRSIIGILCAWVMLLYCVFMAYGATHTFSRFQRADGPGVGQFVTVFVSGAFIGVYIVGAIDFVTRPWTYSGRVELGESGVMIDRRALPWSHFRYASWHDDYPNRLVLQHQKWNCLAAVPSSMKEEVEAFVRTKVIFDVDERNSPRSLTGG